MKEILRIKSITALHNVCGLESPRHPLITIVKKWPQVDYDHENVKITSDLYLISMKGKTTGGSFRYGRNSYDYNEGTMVFLAPNQTIAFDTPIEDLDDSGWTILFHPDLIRKSELGKTIKNYSFFKYDTREALHLSNDERESLTNILDNISLELSQHIDKHSQDIVIQNIESILKYSLRYYDRQFFTRTNLNKDFVITFEGFLEDYFSSPNLSEVGPPTLKQCGEALNISGTYLSDLLKLETGRSAKDHIYSFLLEKAKNKLLNSNLKHFSKLFKSKVGLSPTEFRNLN